jgi:hypothetical protein
MFNGLERTLETLKSHRRKPVQELEVSGCGIYALYLADGASLPGIETKPGGALYVGMTEDGSDTRNHFGHKDSSFSSPRRSLGAILKQEYGLSTVPRGAGKTRKDMINYRFANGGEEKLAQWMLNNLKYSFVVIEENIRDLEKQLIRRMEPPLNLIYWHNPQRKAVMRLRSLCAEEASDSCQSVSARNGAIWDIHHQV